MSGLGRRELLQVAAATAALGVANGGLAQGRGPSQDDLLRFKPVGRGLAHLDEELKDWNP